MKKVTQRTAGVRFTDYCNNPIDINLLIFSREKHWRMGIKANGRKGREEIFVKITEKYLGELNAKLREAAGKLLHHAKIGGSFDEEQLQTDLLDLAKAGNLVFNEIFKKEEAKKTIQGLFDQAEKAGKGIKIEVDSEDFFIPWELLY